MTAANILCLLCIELVGGLKSAQFPKVFMGTASNLWILGQDVGSEWWSVPWTTVSFFLPLFFPNPRVKPKSWSWRTFDLRIMPVTHARCLSAMSAASLTKPSPSSSQTPQVRGDMKGPCSPLALHLLNSHYSSRRITQHSVQGLQHLDLISVVLGFQILPMEVLRLL